MNKFKKITAVFLSALITASLPVVQMYANENYIISSDNARYKYIVNDDNTISIAANEYDKTGIKGDVVLPTQLDGREVVGICKSGFSGCELTSVVVPETICDIGSLAFANCLTLSQVTLHDDIIHMGELAFSNTGFETSLFANSTSDFAIINDYILYLYTGSEEYIEIPDNIRVIANSAFANNGVYSKEEIKNVMCSDGLQYIGDNAFENCESLTRITFKTGLTSVGSNAISSTPIIYGYLGTYVEEFAKTNGNTFIPLIAEGETKIECDYDKGFKQYYFSTDTEFSKEGIHVYKRYSDGTREELTDWDFSTSPNELYIKENS